ncbi:hypothetical protein KAX29_00970 [candidate division WOR-3 bacterium]|nr:hypothetical protein [candidate division WOR-3 bacterium]
MYSLIILFLSYSNFVSFPTDNYYIKDLSEFHNQVGEVVVDDYYYKDQYLYTVKLSVFEEWSGEFFLRNFGTSLQKVVSEALRRKGSAGGGIIPDIDLSIKMPRGLSYIIGEGGHIAVDGSQSIALDLSRNQSTSLSGLQTSAFPQIKLEQRLRANIHGTVGEKIHVKINHDSEAREQDNKLKIWYEGDEDDIVQKIDAGDLKALGGGRNQSVFGIQTIGALGSTSFDIIAGKLESNTSSKTESYSFSSHSDSLPERAYVRDKYYYTGLSESDSLISLVLFIQENTSINHRPAHLIDVNGNPLDESAEFVELTYGDDYELRYLRLSNGSLFPYLRVTKTHSNKRLGLWYVYYDGSLGRIDTLGSLEGDTLILAQLCSQNPVAGDPSWDLMMKNIYSFGTENPTSVDVTIYKMIAGEDAIEIEPVSGKEYIELLGLDVSPVDGKIDIEQVLWSDGCIIFPYDKPFVNPALGADTVPIIYNKRTLIGGEGENYSIVITAASSKGEFFIGYGDLVDSSEVIVVDGDSLTAGVDYRIDYNTGRVVFTENVNLNPDSKISYTYDTEPLFSFTSRYIAKANIKAKPFANSELNLDLAFRSSSNPEPHPRVGMEPSHITRGEVNFSTKRGLGVLDNITRGLPFFDPESESKIRVKGSYGFSLPNPATNGKSYLDDMESVKLSRELEISAGLWNYCSQPDSSIQIDQIGKIDWFNSRIPKTYIYPELPATQRNQYVGTMVLYFQPDTSLPNAYNSWAGIMRAFSAYEDFSQKKYLEVWVKGEDGEIILELGSKMKEDIPRWGRSASGSDSLLEPNGFPDTEDRNGNFELELGEDTGLDGVALDDDDWVYRPDSLDDGRDDYPDQLKTFQDSLKLHRKEGNRRLDSEDINRDHMLEDKDEYFRYRIDLKSSDLVVNSGSDGWKMYRIPLTDSTHYEKIGEPSFENILYTRIWTTKVDKATRVNIAGIAIVGNRWVDKGVRSDPSHFSNPPGGRFLITYRNSFEDEDYVPPVEQEREIYGGYSKEQSLVFKVDSLENKYTCLAESYLELPRSSSGKGYDLRLYKSLLFYSQATSNTSDSVMIFLRLLTDSSNYYQYGCYLYMDGWDTLDVDFQNFYSLKLQNDTLKGRYSLKGNPTLKNIAYIQLGVVNPNQDDFTGEVYFDDIILMGANTDIGSNLSLSVSSNIGDLISDLSYTIHRKSASYKDNLDALRNVGDKETISHNFNVKSNAGKFIGNFVKMPLTFKYDRSSEIPLYRRNSDILLPQEERENESSLSEFQRVSGNIARPSSPSDNWLLRYTVNNIRINGSFSISKSFKPEQKADTVVNRTAGFKYNLPLPSISPPFLSGGSTSLIPSNLHFNADYKNNISNRYTYSKDDSVFQKTAVKPVEEVTPSGGFTYKPIRWINLNYSISGKQNLLYGGRLGKNVSLREGITANHNSDQFHLNNINLTYSNSFTENHGIDYSKTLGDTLDVRSVSQNRTITINDNLKVNQILKKLPIIRGFADNINSIRFTSSFSRNSSFAYLNAFPDYKFRYGIEPEPKGEFIALSNPSDGGTRTKQYNLSSGFNIGRVKIDVSGRFTETRPDEVKLRNSVSANKTATLSFPNVNIQISNIDDYIPPFKGLIKSSRFNVSINMDSTTTRSLVGQEYSEGSATLQLSPTLDLKFKNGFNINIKSGYTKRDNYTNRTDRIHSRANTYDIKVIGDYSFKPTSNGFSLPLFGRLHWKKPINLKATFTMQNNKEISTNLTRDNLEEIRQDSRNITFSLQGNYDFSNMVSGGLSINYRNYLNRKIANDATTSYGASFDVLFKF